MFVTIESLKNLLESCYNIEAPKLKNDSQRKITFVYGANDIARLCLSRIKKYKNSEFIKIDLLGRCGYFREKTDEYIANHNIIISVRPIIGNTVHKPINSFG